jgi:putative heme transporter
MVVVTPGATGVVEVGMAAALGALGAEPAAAAAGVLLYRGLVVGMEVPVGGLALLAWWVGSRRGASAVGARPHVTQARPARSQPLLVPVPVVTLNRRATTLSSGR